MSKKGEAIEIKTVLLTLIGNILLLTSCSSPQSSSSNSTPSEQTTSEVTSTTESNSTSSSETYTLTFKDENTFAINMRDDYRTVTYIKQ